MRYTTFLRILCTLLVLTLIILTCVREFTLHDIGALFMGFSVGLFVRNFFDKD